MFKCQACKKQQERYSSPKKVVVAWRRKTYWQNITDEDGKSRYTCTGDGHEIAKEMSVCSECALECEALNPNIGMHNSESIQHAFNQNEMFSIEGALRKKVRNPAAYPSNIDEVKDLEEWKRLTL